VKSKAVDALIRAALTASTLDDLETAVHALDRVLINLRAGPAVLPANARIAYKTALGHPPVVPALSVRGLDHRLLVREAAGGQPAPAA
jgi:microcin C transport system substrate-binding protein